MSESSKSSIDERIKELKETNPEVTNADLVRILYDEGYNTGEIMKRHLPLKVLKNRPQQTDETVMGAVEGVAPKGAGYLEELKTMIRMEISRSRELTEAFYNLGLGALLASLHKSEMSVSEFRKIALQEGTLKDALHSAGDTVFKALEYYNSDAVSKVEAERDEARAAYTVSNAQLEELRKGLTPGVRLERMITAYLLSGNVTADALSELLDRWLGMEQEALRKVIAA